MDVGVEREVGQTLVRVSLGWGSLGLVWVGFESGVGREGWGGGGEGGQTLVWVSVGCL